VGYPKVIILDEPTVGLDPSQIIEMRRLIRDSSERNTVIVSSHILSEIQAMCGRVIVLHKGKVVADCRTDELAGGFAPGSRVRVRVRGGAEEIRAALLGARGMGNVTLLAQQEPGAWDFSLESAGGADIRVPVFEALAAAGLPLMEALSIGEGSASLEEAFLSLAAGSAGEVGDTP